MFLDVLIQPNEIEIKKQQLKEQGYVILSYKKCKDGIRVMAYKEGDCKVLPFPEKQENKPSLYSKLCAVIQSVFGAK
jgi:hypothetical protein